MTIIFTNGCFDILHLGHMDYLMQSRSLGTKLIVGINSDASIRRLKGPNRPINGQVYRKKMLEHLRWVDEVIIFDDDTPLNLIKELMPDIITKGGDYKASEVVGSQYAPVIIIDKIHSCSTTDIIMDITERYTS